LSGAAPADAAGPRRAALWPALPVDSLRTSCRRRCWRFPPAAPRSGRARRC